MEESVAHSSASQVVRQILEGPVTRPTLLPWRRRQFVSEAGFAGHFGGNKDTLAKHGIGVVPIRNSITQPWRPST